MNKDNVNARMNDILDELLEYSIPEEGACSAEFPSGCILCDES